MSRTQRTAAVALVVVLAAGCGGDIGVGERAPETTGTVETLAPFTTSTSPPSTTSSTTSTTTPSTTVPETTTTSQAPTTTLVELAAADVEADTSEGYAESLVEVLVDANLVGCEQLVETTAFELDAIFGHTHAWLERFAAAEADGTLDVREMQASAELTASKLLMFEGVMGEVASRVAGGESKYATLAGEAAGNVADALLIWSYTGVDVDAGTYDLNQLEEFGFSEHLAELQFQAGDVDNPDLAREYCG